MQTTDSTALSVHVVPGRKGSWSVRTDVDADALSVHSSTTEAARAAYRLARACGSQRVIVHDRYCRLHTVSVNSPAAERN